MGCLPHSSPARTERRAPGCGSAGPSLARWTETVRLGLCGRLQLARTQYNSGAQRAHPAPQGGRADSTATEAAATGAYRWRTASVAPRRGPGLIGSRIARMQAPHAPDDGTGVCGRGEAAKQAARSRHRGQPRVTTGCAPPPTRSRPVEQHWWTRRQWAETDTAAFLFVRQCSRPPLQTGEGPEAAARTARPGISACSLWSCGARRRPPR